MKIVILLFLIIIIKTINIFFLYNYIFLIPYNFYIFKLNYNKLEVIIELNNYLVLLVQFI